MRELDLLCMGRAAVDLYAQQRFCSLEEVDSFAKYVGGCPANIAIGSSRLGLKTGILSRVGDEAMGRFVRKTMENEGVDVSTLRTDRSRLTGLVLLGINPPDHFPLIFYRENCADMAIETTDFDLETMKRTRALLVTGTHCSQEHSYQVTLHAVQLAQQADTQLILELDYRPVLWGVTGHGSGESRYAAHPLVAERLAALFPYSSLIVGTDEELLIATNQKNVDQAIEVLQAKSSAIIIRKRGHLGSEAYLPNSQIPVTSVPYKIKVLNVLGAGDAFISGFLRGYLRDMPIEKCLQLGNANGAMVVSRHGCSPAMPYWEELCAFMSVPTEIEPMKEFHSILDRPAIKAPLCFLAFDHRIPFKRLASQYNRSKEDICRFKLLITQALQSLDIKTVKTVSLGIIVDQEYGENVLRATINSSLIKAMPIESANSYPLQFLDGKEAAHILKEWPSSTIIKVLCYLQPELYEPDFLQIGTLKKLQRAAHESGHRLMIELAYLGKAENLSTIALMVERCYKEGIMPDWWKLPPIPDQENWRTISHLINRYDPKICGVLLLGGLSNPDELPTLFETVRYCCPSICGFAVGRAIWGSVAEQWFSSVIDDEQAVCLISSAYEELLKHWSHSITEKESFDEHSRRICREPLSIR